MDDDARIWTPEDGPMPALYLGHGAPPLLDDPTWTAELARWSGDLPKPTAILIVSAHWESAPLTLGATDGAVPLTYDFYGFPERYYRITYPSPGAPDLAAKVRALMPDTEEVAHAPGYGLDHGAFVPLLVMYPSADVPVLQISMPGFLTHGLPFLRDFRPHAEPPAWSVDFDEWARESLAGGDVDTLMDFRRRGPGMPYAHPTVEHFAPLFVTLGASSDPEAAPRTAVEGFFYGLAKRSIQVA
jgi:4,5-DOPA dioxygenase extradiol